MYKSAMNTTVGLALTKSYYKWEIMAKSVRDFTLDLSSRLIK